MEQRFRDYIIKREEEGLLRELHGVTPLEGGFLESAGRTFINLSSNDYLSIAAHPLILESCKLADNFGSGASRLMTGTGAAHLALEDKVASFKGKEKALLFNSGYQANVGIISSICEKGDVVFADKLVHASIIDGIVLSGAKLFRFRHNDTEHLKDLLDKERVAYKNALVVTESIFSMDGDVAPLGAIAELKNKYEFTLMVDEAHATGVFGDSGSGMAEETSTTRDIDIIMGTFSKALGGFGAYAAISSDLREYLINSCRSFIYSTSLPYPVVEADSVALDIVEKEPFRREELLENAEYLRSRLKEEGFEVRGASQIIPIVIGGNEDVVSLSDCLKDAGFWVTPVRPPTVPKGEARLRISLNYAHSRKSIDDFMDSLICGAKTLV